MSALEKALRKVELQRQNPGEKASPLGAGLGRHAASSSSNSHWVIAVLVLVCLALLVILLMVSGLLHLPQKTVSRSSHAGKVQESGSVNPMAEPSLALSRAGAPALTRHGPLTPVSLTQASIRPALAAAEPTGAVVAAPSVEMGKKFTFPAWQKTADRLWGWGLWESASRMWLHGLKSEDSKMAVLLIADDQTLAQATKQYAAWSAHVPVVVVPKKASQKKLWLVLAVPVAAELERARQFFSLAQGMTVHPSSLAQWQGSFEAMELIDAGSPKPKVASASTGTGVPGSVSPSVISVASAAPSAAPSAPVATVAPATLAPALPAPRPPAPAAAPEVKIAANNTLDSEPPQLSRTTAERLPKTGAVSPAAKAIDVDFQSVEKSLARGEHQAALDAVIKLEKYIGENWRTQYLMGVSWAGLTRWDQAIVALAKAQELNPKHALVAIYHSIALQERGEHAKGIQVLSKAEDSQPQSPELWLNQAHSYQALGYKAEANKAYNRFLELSVNRPDLTAQRAWVQSRLQKDNG